MEVGYLAFVCMVLGHVTFLVNHHRQQSSGSQMRRGDPNACPSHAKRLGICIRLSRVYGVLWLWKRENLTVVSKCWRQIQAVRKARAVRASESETCPYLLPREAFHMTFKNAVDKTNAPHEISKFAVILRNAGILMCRQRSL